MALSRRQLYWSSSSTFAWRRPGPGAWRCAASAALVGFVAAAEGCGGASVEQDASRSPDKAIVVFGPVRGEGGLTPYGVTSAFLVKKLRECGHRVHLEPTSGSLNTLLAIDAELDHAAIGIAQSDVLYHYLTGSHPMFPQARTRSRIRAITPLFPEWLRVHRTTQQLDDETAVSVATQRLTEVLDDDRRVTIYGGPTGSGTLVTAHNVSRTLFVGACYLLPQSPPTPAPPGDSVDELTFRVTSPTSRFVPTPLAGRTGADPWPGPLVMLSEASVKILTGAFEGSYHIVPAAEAVPNIFKPYTNDAPNDPSLGSAATIGLNAVLVGTSSLPDDVVTDIRDILREVINTGFASGSGDQVQVELSCQPIMRDSIQPLLDPPQLTELVSSMQRGPSVDATSQLPPNEWTLLCQTAIAGFGNQATSDTLVIAPFLNEGKIESPVALHPAVQIQTLAKSWRYLVTLPPWVLRSIGVAVAVVLAGALALRVLGPLLHGGRGPRRTTRLLDLLRLKGRLAIVVVAFLVVHVVVASMIWAFEYYADTPEPKSGNLALGPPHFFAQIMRFVVMGQFSERLHSEMSVMWLAGLRAGYALFAISLTVMMSHTILEWTRGMNGSSKTVIIGWNAHGQNVLDEARAAVKSVRVLAPPTNGLPDEDRYPVEENESVLDALRRIPKWNGAAVILLGDKRWATAEGDGDVDLWVLRTLARVRQAAPSETVIVEIEHPSNAPLARGVGASEVVCVNRFGVQLLAHAALEPRIVDVFDEFLRTSADSNEIYFNEIDCHEHKRVKTFRELVAERAERAPADQPQVVIGLLRSIRPNGSQGEPRALLNPSGAEARLQPGDKAIVVCRQRPAPLGLVTTIPPGDDPLVSRIRS